MDNQNDIISRMNEKFSTMSKSHKAIAAYITDHYDQAVFMTAAKLGETLGISESTVVRFASGIGYEGYPEFQKALEDWVKNKLNSVQKIDAKYGRSTQSEILTSVLTSDMNKIADTIENLDPIAFETAVDTILAAKHVYIVGIRSCEPLADFLSFYLTMIRGDVCLVRTTSASETFEQMIRVNEEDVVIGISFPRYSMRTLKAMEFARDRNAKVITITDTVHSPMKRSHSLVHKTFCADTKHCLDIKERISHSSRTENNPANYDKNHCVNMPPPIFFFTKSRKFFKGQDYKIHQSPRDKRPVCTMPHACKQPNHK